MVILHIRQAEVALAAGRLEEACALLQRPDVRVHRRGQELLTRLVDAFIARGRAHLDASRWHEALRDAGQAEQLGGLQPSIAALQREAADHLSEARDRADRRAALGRQAMQQLDTGELSRAEAIVDQGRQLDLSMRDVAAAVDDRRQRAAAAIQRAREALDQDEWLTALYHWQRAYESHAACEALLSLTHALSRAVGNVLQQHLDVGCLHDAAALQAQCRLLADADSRLAALFSVLPRCREAAQALDTGQLDQAMLHLRHLRAALPHAQWIAQAIAQVEKARAAINVLWEGPLGAAMTLSDPSQARTPIQASSVASLPRAVSCQPHAPLPARFFLHVEGGQSVLIVNRSVVEIGPVSTSRPVDVPLMLPADATRIRIEQRDDEHFVTGMPQCKVNGDKVVRRALLDGDRLQLGGRSVVRYKRPHPASGSAVLELENVRMAQPNVRCIILLNGPLVIGRGGAVHVQAPHLDESMIVQCREGRLWAQCGVGEKASGGTWLAFDKSIDIGRARLLICE